MNSTLENRECWRVGQYKHLEIKKKSKTKLIYTHSIYTVFIYVFEGERSRVVGVGLATPSELTLSPLLPHFT